MFTFHVVSLPHTQSIRAASPVCSCHEEPMYWHKDQRRTEDGYWVCSRRNREQAQEWRTRNPQKVRSISRIANLRRYGLTPEQYENLLDAQGGGCRICGKAAEKNGRVLAVDHDHDTGVVRSLLCDNCNTALGQLEEDPKRFRAAVAYLEEWTCASML